MARPRVSRRVQDLPLGARGDGRPARGELQGQRRRARGDPRSVRVREEHAPLARRGARPAVGGRGPVARRVARPARRGRAGRVPRARPGGGVPERQPVARPVGARERGARAAARGAGGDPRPRAVRAGLVRAGEARRQPAGGAVRWRAAGRGDRGRRGAGGEAALGRRADRRARRRERAVGARGAGAPAVGARRDGARGHPLERGGRRRGPCRRDARREEIGVSERLLELDAVVVAHATAGTEVRALDGVDFALDAGESVALWGPSGSGKTTLLHVLGGLVPPTRGRALWRGEPLLPIQTVAELGHRTQRVAYVFQGSKLLPTLTAYENVAFARWASGTNGHRAHSPDELLGMVGLAAKLDALPGELSGGEAQRVAIARALGHSVAVARIGAMSVFVAHSLRTMTTSAVRSVPLDWQGPVGSYAKAGAVAGGVARQPGVAYAAPAATAPFAGISHSGPAGQSNSANGSILAVPPDYAHHIGSFRFLQGGLKEGSVVLDQQLAATLQARIGDTVAMPAPKGAPARKLTVSGVSLVTAPDVLFQPLNPLLGPAPAQPPSDIAVMPVATFAKSFSHDLPAIPAGSAGSAAVPGAQSGVQWQVQAQIAPHALRGTPSHALTQATRLKNRVERSLPGQVQFVDNLSDSLNTASGDALYADTLYIMLAVPGAIVALGLAYLAALGSAGRDRHDLALLRARGASRRHLVLLAVSESAVLGVVAGALGTGAALVPAPGPF